MGMRMIDRETHFVEDLEAIHIKRNSFAGQPPPLLSKSILVSDGGNNFVTLRDNGTTLVYRVVLEEHHILPIRKLVDFWKASGINAVTSPFLGQVVNIQV